MTFVVIGAVLGILVAVACTAVVDASGARALAAQAERVSDARLRHTIDHICRPPLSHPLGGQPVNGDHELEEVRPGDVWTCECLTTWRLDDRAWQWERLDDRGLPITMRRTDPGGSTYP